MVLESGELLAQSEYLNIHMKKNCIFCGSLPYYKTKEHVIPQWLIEMTGDPNRQAIFGPNYESKNSKYHKFSFDSFTFPSCKKCNEKSAELEIKAKRIVSAMLSAEKLASIDVHYFLSWLDKVRIGLWLGMMSLQKNALAIKPNYYINNRLSLYDRIVIVYRFINLEKRLNMIGIDLPAFQYMPSCFSLLVNNYCFFNVSTLSLCSQRLGFPFTTEHKSIENSYKKIEVSLRPGLQRAKYPIIRKSFFRNGVLLAQPIFKESLSAEVQSTLFETAYIHQNSLDYDEGIGRPFMEKGGATIRYPELPSIDWLPKQEHAYGTFLYGIHIQTYDYQLELLRESFSGAQRTSEYKLAKKISILWKNHVAKQIKRDFKGDLTNLSITTAAPVGRASPSHAFERAYK